MSVMGGAHEIVGKIAAKAGAEPGRSSAFGPVAATPMLAPAHSVSGELALVVVVLINSLGVVLMLHSGAGISAISSVPFAFSEVLPQLTLGTWTYIFQGLLVSSLMFMRRRFVPAYLFSFVVGFFFGVLMDIWRPLVDALPALPPLQVIYFVLSYLLICFGIAISNRCGLPIVPTDLFPREFSSIVCLPYSKVKVTFDITCLLVTGVLTFVCLGYVDGLGVGTVAAALTMGKVIGCMGEAIDARAVIAPRWIKVLN